ncbi:unnamed protein product [Peronospora effusa]|nr:unnamed protein product [Peronospora effusa]
MQPSLFSASPIEAAFTRQNGCIAARSVVCEGVGGEEAGVDGVGGEGADVDGVEVGSGLGNLTRKVALLKAVSGRGLNTAPWVLQTHDDLYLEFRRKVLSVKFYASVLRLVAKNVIRQSDSVYNSAYIDQKDQKPILEINHPSLDTDVHGAQQHRDSEPDGEAVGQPVEA